MDRITDVVSLNMTVWPTDLDMNMHMNNGRYLTIMDLGRLAFILKSGLWRFVFKHKSVPILSAAKIRYRLPLNPFQKFRLETRILGWDEKWFYIEQRFILAEGDKKDAVAAIALVKGSFFDNQKKQIVAVKDLLEVLGTEEASPDLPDYVLSWQAAENALKAATKRD